MRQLFPTGGDVDLADAYRRLAPTGSSRTVVRLNMIASVDGAGSLAGRSGALGGPADRSVFAALRSLADVVAVGAGTMRAEAYGPARLPEEARARRVALGLPPVPPIAVITRSCRLDWQSPFFHDAEQRPLVITVASASAADRAQAEEVADVIIAGDRDVTLPGAVAALADRGHVNVLCEGGPGVAGQLAQTGLLHEFCLTIAPLVAAGEASRIVVGPPLIPPARLQLGHVLEADGYLFLRYGQP